MAEKLEQERQQELELLRSKLSKIQQKFLNEWTGETLRNLTKLRTQKVSHEVQCGQGIQIDNMIDAHYLHQQ